MVDMNTIAGTAIAELVRAPLVELYASFRTNLSITRAQFESAFQRYSDMTMRRCSFVRTLYSTQEPIELEDIYVPPGFMIQQEHFPRSDKRIDENDLIYKFAQCERLIVKGNGGCGKTVFLKKLWLSRFKNPSGRLPILVELRRLNEMQNPDLFALCRNELQADIVFKDIAFEELCRIGRFEFILDGFDEIVKEKRNEITRQILDIAERFPKCPILVSGREDDRFISWGPFVTYSVAPLTKKEAVQLIRKVPFEREIKNKFCALIEDSYYDKHRSFLSNPLLAVMMMMTYRRNGSVSDKVTQFYNDAFQTLLSWHDGTKEAFVRERALGRDSIRPVFSTFCLISYYDQIFEFSEDLVRTYIKKALKYHRMEDNLDDVLRDFCETVNLLQKDGLYYVFVHRSFQEYFAAECAMQVVSGSAREFLEDFAMRKRDSTFSMCYEIHPELVYDFYLVSRISKYEESEFCHELRKRAPRGFSSRMTEYIEIDYSEIDGKLRASGVRMGPSSSIDHINLLELVRELKNPNALDLQFMILDDGVFAYLTMTDKAIDTFGRVKAGAQISVKIEFSNESKFSIVQAKKISPDDKRLNRFEGKVQSEFPAYVQKVKKLWLTAVRDADKLIVEMRESRETRKDSIDGILGIAED